MTKHPLPTDDRGMPDRLKELADSACAHLDEMVQLCIDAAGTEKADAVRNALKVAWLPGDDPHLLAETLFDQALAGASDTSPVRSGHIYCYACNAANCEHSSPGTHGEVFMGYRNNGEPIWQEFFNALNLLEDQRVDTVFGDRAKPLAKFVSRRALITDQLLGSGRNSMTYRIVCQVIAGYFDIAGKRCALTLQVVENPKRQLFMQLLAPDSVREVMTESQKQNRTLSRLYAAISDLRHRLQELQTHWRSASGQKGRKKALTQIERLMHHQVNVIEQKGRQGERRTKHAHDRSQDNRPVHTALKDIEAASVEGFYHDKPRNSIIVLGKRGRAHVFSVEGRHITTMQLPLEKLDRRVQRNRYTPMAADDIQAFRATVSGDID